MRYASFIIAAFALTACKTTAPDLSSVAPDVKPEPVVAAVQMRPVETQIYPLLSRARDLETALSAFEARDYARAAQLYGLLIARGEDLSEWRLNYADSLLAIGEMESAKNEYDRFPKHPRAISGLALMALNAPELSPDEREIIVNTGLEAAPHDPRLWNALGQVYDLQGRHIDAQDAYITAMRFGGDAASGVNNLGMSLMLQGRFADARDKFAQAAALSGDAPRFTANVRLVTALLDGPEAAIAGMDDTPAAQLLNDAGYIALTRGDTYSARALFEKAIELSPVYFPVAEENLRLSRAG